MLMTVVVNHKIILSEINSLTKTEVQPSKNGKSAAKSYQNDMDALLSVAYSKLIYFRGGKPHKLYMYKK